MKSFIKKILKIPGYELNKIQDSHVSVHEENTFPWIFSSLLEKNRIDVVFDIGANNGTWANGLRDSGYKKKIISVEPQYDIFKQLKKRADSDNDWDIFHCAIGEKETTMKLNIANNKLSSSLLKMTDKHIIADANSSYVKTEKVPVRRIENLAREILPTNYNAFLKIDTQGFEKQVLDGSKGILKSIKGIQVEMSFDELYEGELTFSIMLDYIKGLGFTLCHIDNGFKNQKTGELLQIDGVFYRI